MSTKIIGPTFGDELVSANLQDGVGWDESGDVWFNDGVPQSQRDAVMAIYAAHDPNKAIVPSVVTRYQARAALSDAGFLDQVNEYFSGLPDDDLGRMAWEQAPTVVRDCDATNIAAQALGLSSETIDELFIQAATY